MDTTIEIPPLLNAIAREGHDRSWIVEGAGGVLVPINDDGQTMADLMIGLGLPIIVVARTTLGTINHTLLTLDALRRRELHVAGVVMVGDSDSDNTAAIEQYGSVAVLGHMPRFDPLTAEALEAWSRSGLDPEGRLLQRLR
jgi:dethiobiotin synthetase